MNLPIEIEELQRKQDLKDIIKYAEEISGQWNGKEDGIIEDRAHIANQIINMCEDIIELLEELK